MQATTRNALNRLLQIHYRSFAQYLRYARPHAPAGSEVKMQVIDHIAEDQQVMAERIIGVLRGAAETPNLGNFPMEFTDVHDLSIEYAILEAIRYQRHDLRAIQECVRALKDSPAAMALAEEAEGMAHGHLQSLEEAAADCDRAIASPSAGAA
jgi:bacterioferritin (cytochrome b1)